MPQLNWDELDFLDYLDFSPVIDEFGTSHIYEIQQNDLRLLIIVWQFESAIQLSLIRDVTNATIFSFACYVRGKARYVHDKRGKYLELGDCVIAPDRFWYLEAGDVFDRNRFPHGLTIELEVRPDIRVAVMPCPSR
jgi:hypothetical protein